MKEWNDVSVVQVVLMVLCAFLLLLTTFVAFFMAFRKRATDQKLKNRHLQIEMQEKLIRTSIEIQERERVKLAHDLHDEVNSKLYATLMYARLLEEKQAEEESREIVANIVDILEKAIEKIREITQDLIPNALSNKGLHDEMINLCSQFINIPNLKIIYNNPFGKEAFKSFDPQRQIHLYRIIKELVNNSLKHGKATAIRIDVQLENSLFTLNYSDNGVGAEQKQLFNSDGIGVKGILFRSEIVGGNAEFLSATNKGLHFKLQVKL